MLNIRVHRRDDGDRLEFEKDTLDPLIIIGEENVQLRMKKERPSLCERGL